MNKKPIPPQGRILREGEEPTCPIFYNKENNLENKIQEKDKTEKNKTLITAFLLAGTACLGMGYFCDNKEAPFSTAGYIGAGLYYFTAGVYSFGDKIKGYLGKRE